MAHIDDKVLEADILPVIYPVLKWKKPEENKDMYESAHAAVLAVFSAQKGVSRELAGVYAQMLVDVSLFLCGVKRKNEVPLFTFSNVNRASPNPCHYTSFGLPIPP